MKTKFFKTFLLTVLSFGTVFSQGFNKQKLDSLFDILGEKNKIMGSLTISKNGNVLYKRSVGYSVISDKEKIPATEKTKYRIGSVGKMFTATMIFQLIEEGTLSLSTTLDRYFPKLPNANNITIGHLLNHRSGIHEFTDDTSYATWMEKPKTQEEILELISKHPVDFQPGEKSAYSNSNFAILGYILENVTERSYAKNLSERITSKIGLSNTYAGSAINTNNNESFSYRFSDTWEREKETDLSIPGGAGCIVSTPTDLTKFIEALFSLKLVSKNSLTHMQTITDRYGMGMRPAPFFTKKGYGHNGRIDGFRTNLAYFPENSVAISFCSNGEYYPVSEILIGALSIYFNREYSIPTFKSITLSTDELDKYLGDYSSKQMPLKITITKENTTLFAQATGQGAFPLTPTEQDKFTFDEDGVKVEFTADKNEFTITQRGTSFLFTKDK
ncbi:MAG: beta-lactamase family protein [Ignavibacteriales bacterium]|nr:beta-lactamase family protein [Ignavibacteriales bacterium]